MTRTDVGIIAEAGAAKLEFSKRYLGRYLTRGAMAGVCITVGTLLSLSCGAWFYTDALPVAKLLAAVTFSAALVLIVLLGGELFTGANFIMAVSLFEERVPVSGVLRVFVLTYLGNFLGIAVLCMIVSGSGASHDLLAAYLAVIIPPKLSCAWYMLLLRGALCNFLVCLGVFAGFKVKSDGGKMAAVVLVITTFVILGFEHSIANMASFSLYALLVSNPDWAGMGWNLLWVTLGNIVGGGILLGLPVWYCAEPANEPNQSKEESFLVKK